MAPTALFFVLALQRNYAIEIAQASRYFRFLFITRTLARPEASET